MGCECGSGRGAAIVLQAWPFDDALAIAEQVDV